MCDPIGSLVFAGEGEDTIEDAFGVLRDVLEMKLR